MTRTRNIYQRVLGAVSRGAVWAAGISIAFTVGIVLEDGLSLFLASRATYWLCLFGLIWAVCGVLARVPQDD